MKRKDFDKEVVRNAIEEIIEEYKLYEFCPFCGSDDFDVLNKDSKKCYNCNMIIKSEDINESIIQKFMLKLDKHSFKKFKKSFEAI